MKNQALKGGLALVMGLLFSCHSMAEANWIDVRSVLEHKLDSIEGDVRISHSDIVVEIQKMFPDKSTEIKLYCRSGGRAGKAMKALESAGYTHVENVGSIEDARKYREMGEGLNSDPR